MLGQKAPKLVIAEDTPELRILYAAVLRMDGLEVVEAEDGIDALEKVLEHQPDLFIVDHMMPGISGLQVCHELQQRNINVKVIVVSAAVGIEDEVRQLGLHCHLVKPVDMKTLRSKVRAALGDPGGTFPS